MTTRKGNESIVQKENCFVGEIKEVELRSRRGKFIYNRTYNPVGLNKVSHFSRRGRAPSRLPMKKLKSLLKETRIVRLFVWKGILKNTPLSSKIHCYGKNRYRSNRKSVRFLLRAIPKLVLKKNCQKWLQCLSDFSSLNTVKVMLITCTVMPELKGITTVCHLRHSWLQLQLIHFNCGNCCC